MDLPQQVLPCELRLHPAFCHYTGMWAVSVWFVRGLQIDHILFTIDPGELVSFSNVMSLSPEQTLFSIERYASIEDAGA
eukprot:2093365-Amphidinium_carterae.1